MVDVRSIVLAHSNRPDFNGDGLTDLLWRGPDGSLVIWNMDPSGVAGALGAYIPSPDPTGNLSLRGYGDVNGNGTTDLVWQDRAGRIETWTFHDNEFTVTPLTIYGLNHQQIRAIGDFNGDARDDLLWFVPPAPVPGGADGVWVTGDAQNRKIPAVGLGPMKPISVDFDFVGVGDFNGDGRDDLLFRGTGNAAVHTMLIEMPTGAGPGTDPMPTMEAVFRDPGSDWMVRAIADWNGDGKSDILWENAIVPGARTMSFMDGGTIYASVSLWDPGPDWSIAGADDYDNNGRADLIWHHTSGWNAEWRMDGASIVNFGGSFANDPSAWSL